MKTYVKPNLVSEKFIANEYIAACYVINCNVPGLGTLYNESNGVPGLQTRGIFGQYDADEKVVSNVYACNEWHKGVFQNEAPKANGYWKYQDSIFGRTKTAEVYWWNENLGSQYDVHATTILDKEWETNPNAS